VVLVLFRRPPSEPDVPAFRASGSPVLIVNDRQHGCGVSHLAYLTVVVNREHLCPFALRAAFPLSLVGRDSHDYYEHSVTVGLAPLRPSRIPLCAGRI
jgi:hypothetical protein